MEPNSSAVRGMRRKYISKSKKVMQHGEFIDRIRKTLYYGVGTTDSDMEVSSPLAEYAADLFSEPHRGHSLNRLTCVTAGKMHATPCSLIMALIYLDRLNLIDPDYVKRITPQELFIVSLMISTKLYTGHDEEFYFQDWAYEGKMSEARLKELELEFLTAIDWNIYISNEQFFEKLSSVERTLAQREGLFRGWLTYSELVQLFPSSSLSLMKFLAKNVAMLALSYAASVITIAGAFYLASQVPGTLWHRRPQTSAAGTATTATLTTPVAMPVSTTNDTQAAPVNSTTSNIVIGGKSSLSESCDALNVEAELLKLEQQYCAEARLNEMQRARRLDKTQQLLTPSHRPIAAFDRHETAQHWLNFKSVYSEDNNNILIFGHDAEWNAQNVSVFWQMLSDMMQHSFILRWPEMWPKLM